MSGKCLGCLPDFLVASEVVSMTHYQHVTLPCLRVHQWTELPELNGIDEWHIGARSSGCETQINRGSNSRHDDFQLEEPIGIDRLDETNIGTVDLKLETGWLRFRLSIVIITIQEGGPDQVGRAVG